MQSATLNDDAAADACAHEAYFALADVVDNLQSKGRWARQQALLDWRDEKAGEVKKRIKKLHSHQLRQGLGVKRVKNP